MMVPFFQIQSLTKKNEIRSGSKGQVSDVAQALVQFALTNGRYPLPANPVFGLDDPNSGIEATAMLGATEVLRDSGIKNGPNNKCGLTNPNDKMYCGDGMVATNIATAPFGLNDPGNRIIIGALPYTVLGLTPQQSLDEYGNKMTYAVTYGLTKARTFSNDKGNISVRDQLTAGQPQGCELVMDSGPSSDKTHFVVVSHGQNRLGAYSMNGGDRTCTGLDVASPDEFENCDDNQRFRMLSTRRNESCTNAAVSFIHRMPGANTPTSFDDMIAFRTTLNTGNWTAQRTVDTNGVNIYQTYLGYRNSKENVVIGNISTQPTPTRTMKRPGTGQVQVEGTGNNVQADRIESSYLCSVKDKNSNIIRTDLVGDSCFRIKFLAQRNSILGLNAPLNAIVPNSFDNTTTATKLYYDVLAGHSGGDRGMLRIDSRTTSQAQSPKLRFVDTTNTTVSQCGDTGVRGVNSDGTLRCNP